MVSRFDFNEVAASCFTSVQCAKIRETVIGVAGAGGLGSNCAVNLVRCGFSHFVIVDSDTVEASNLNRQAYSYTQIGRDKVDALRENLLGINPGVAIKTHSARITRQNAISLFGKCGVIIEAFDNPEDKAMLAELFAYSGKLFVCASGVAGFGNSDRIRVTKKHDLFYIIGDLVTGISKTVKPYAPCVALAAAKQADIVLSWVLADDATDETDLR